MNNNIKVSDMDVLLANVWDNVSMNVDKKQVVILYNQVKKDPENFKKRIMFILDRISNINLTPEQLELVRREAKTLKRELEDDVNSSVLSGKITANIFDMIMKGMVIFYSSVLSFIQLNMSSDEYINKIYLADYSPIVKYLSFGYYIGINSAILLGIYLAAKYILNIIEKYAKENLNDNEDLY